MFSRLCHRGHVPISGLGYSLSKTTLVNILKSPRAIHASPRVQAHGFLEGLTQMRITTPWIDILESQRKTNAMPGVLEPKPKNLTPKKMSDSLHRVSLPLTQDKWLSDTYLNVNGNIRIGTLLMDLDALSGMIAYKHAGDGVIVVTAACDRINIEHPLTKLCDLEYSGQVTYATGRSSMEITCQVSKASIEGREQKAEDVLLTCNFTMVALDPKTRRATSIAPLNIETPEEKRLFELGEHRSRHKKSLAEQNLLKRPPSAEESTMIHNMWLKQRAYDDPNDAHNLPGNVHPMSATRMETSAIMQPQFRNLNHFAIFGGFLMKSTYELAFCCAANVARARPSFVSLDPSRFMNPVPVGSVLYLTAHVCYTDPPLVDITGESHENSDHGEVGGRSDGSFLGNAKDEQGKPAASRRTRMQVRVDSMVRDVEHGPSQPTGQFNYTFTVDKDVKVLPQTYEDFMMYVDARRRAINADVARGKSETAGKMVESHGPSVTE